MKSFIPKRVPLAGFLAAGFTIIGGLVMSLVVVVAFSDSLKRDIALLVIVFSMILLVPIQALRRPKDPMERKRHRRWRWPWRRQKRREKRRLEWKRRRGQNQHQPFGARPLGRHSTFVSAPRKPTEP